VMLGQGGEQFNLVAIDVVPGEAGAGSGGVQLSDADGDGDLDALVISAMITASASRLDEYSNDGLGHFAAHVVSTGVFPSAAVAADLKRYGCEVTVYEALHVVGGVLQYGIPSFRLPREIIAREVDHLKALGVKFETNKVIGKTFTVPQLLDGLGYDAVFLGVGAGAPTFLGIEGEQAGQVYSANEFLTRVNLMGGDKFPYLDTPVAYGKSVVVIGAGNTTMDCLRVSKRIGAERVRCVYRRTQSEAPARVEEIRHAMEEGIEFFWLHSPTAIHADAEGNVHSMTGALRPRAAAAYVVTSTWRAVLVGTGLAPQARHAVLAG